MMDDKEILELAAKISGYPVPKIGAHKVLAFARDIEKAAREDEMAACVKECKKVSYGSGGDQYNMFGKDLAIQCAAAIRARNNLTQGETK